VAVLGAFREVGVRGPEKAGDILLPPVHLPAADLMRRGRPFTLSEAPSRGENVMGFTQTDPRLAK
jgi:hypothetical protein